MASDKLIIMAIDTRDWHIKKLRKKTGYVERAGFRLPFSQAEGKIPFKLHSVWVFFIFLAVALPCFVWLVRQIAAR